MDEMDSHFFQLAFKDHYLRLQRGKHLEAYQLIPEYYYFPIDGSEFFSSEDIHCGQCLVKEYKKDKNTYSHQGIAGRYRPPGSSAGHSIYVGTDLQ